MARTGTEDVDTASFDAFVHRHHEGLLRAAALLTGGDRAAGEDLVQTAWARVWPHWTTVEAMEFPVAYVRTVVVRAFVSSRRRRWWREDPVAALPDHGRDDAGDDVALRQVVTASLARLPARQRAVVVLRFLDDLDVTATAEALGCSPGTVKSQTAKALHRLRDDATLADLLEGL